MNSVKFKLAKSVDYCIDLFNLFKATCHKIFRALFKDTRQRPQVFSCLNLGLSALCVLPFCLNNFAIKKPTLSTYRWIFAISVIVLCILSVVLIYSYKKRKHILCKIWCLSETSVIFTILYMTLSESVHIAWPGLTVLGLSMIIKLYGLWVMYYFSLEVENSPESRHDDEEEFDIDQERYKAKYIAKRSLMTRRDTDQTSIASQPPSPVNFEDDDDHLDECGDSVLDDNSPTAASIMFFHNENIFNHEPHHRPYSIESTASKDNIIISDLMCGGSSSLNAELQGK